MLKAFLVLVVAAPLALAGAAPSHAAGPSAVPGPLWPASICTPSTSDRFATTTDGDQGNIVIEPASPHATPTITRAWAYRNFLRLYGRRVTAAQRRHTQVRFGLVTDLSSGPASGNVVEYVPELRRTPAWIITNCVDARVPPEPGTPPGFRSRGPGQLTFAVADTRAPKLWSYEFLPAHPHHGSNPGATSPYVGPHPSARLTPYYSTPWHATSYRRGSAVLIRYQPKRCYTLDHVNVSGYRGTYDISVILSGGASGQCLRPSVTAPYTEIRPASNGGPIRRFRHDRTGPATFEPESA